MKRIMPLVLGIIMIFVCGTPAFALEKPQVPQRQIEVAIQSIDEVELRHDTLNNVVDPSVPASIRNSFRVEAELTVEDPTYENPYEIGDICSTVKRVGEIDYGNGETGTMYVASAAVDVKYDSGYDSNLGAEVWSTVYWIDNLGVNNELYAVDAAWITTECDYATSDKIMRYGTVALGSRIFLDSIVEYIPDYETYKYVDCHGQYTGFSFACMAQMRVGPSPVTVTSWAITSLTS